jgi:flagellar basal-body rod protein FlgC
MGMFDALEVSASALTAERLRMDVTAENLANAQSTRGANGGVYRRKEVVLQEASPKQDFGASLRSAMAGNLGGTADTSGAPGGVEVAAIAEDTKPSRMVYDPGHPDADAKGYVAMPNVDSVTEMVDLISSSRSYDANVTAMQASKQMFTKTLDLLR